jgi:hypothetical protein
MYIFAVSCTNVFAASGEASGPMPHCFDVAASREAVAFSRHNNATKGSIGGELGARRLDRRTVT